MGEKWEDMLIFRLIYTLTICFDFSHQNLHETYLKDIVDLPKSKDGKIASRRPAHKNTLGMMAVPHQRDSIKSVNFISAPIGKSFINKLRTATRNPQRILNRRLKRSGINETYHATQKDSQYDKQLYADTTETYHKSQSNNSDYVNDVILNTTIHFIIVTPKHSDIVAMVTNSCDNVPSCMYPYVSYIAILIMFFLIVYLIIVFGRCVCDESY